jgi:hypothetical protein
MGCSGASPAARFYGRNPAHGRGQLMAGLSELADLFLRLLFGLGLI